MSVDVADAPEVDDQEAEQVEQAEDKTPKPGPRKPADDDKLTKAEWQELFEKDVLPKRLSRKEKEVFKQLGIQSPDEYATIVTKAQKFDEFEESKLNADEKWQREKAVLQTQVESLLARDAEKEKKLLVRELADELSVPKKLLPFVQGDDEDSLRESMQSLLDAVSEVGGPKKDTKQKTPDDSVKEKRVAFGGGGAKPDKTIDPDALAKKIRQSQNNLLAR